jgi:membrane fusion protein YbhG
MSRHVLAASLAALLAAGSACRKPAESAMIVAAGHVEATDVHISTKVAGRLQSAPKQEGDLVKAGEELARIDTTDIDLALRQARADRAQAAAELALRLAGARKEDIAELEAQIRSTEADLSGAQLDLDRMQGLLDRGSGTTKARDDARTRRDVLAARLAAQHEALARLRAGFRKEEIDAARARLAALDARVAQLEQQRKDAVTSSPLDGVVTERVAEPGELLQVGAPICVITRLADAWLTAYVPAPDLARIRLGQPAEVRTDDGQTRKGTLTFISSEAEFTPKNVQTRDERVKLVYRIKVALQNADGLFKPGMPAEALLQAAAAAR